MTQKLRSAASPAGSGVLDPGWALRALDYAFLLRPTLFFPVWTVYAAGFLAAQRLSPTAADPFLPAFALTLLMGGAYILNQIFDAETDRDNDKLFLIADGHVSVRTAGLESATLLIAGIGLAFLSTLEVAMSLLATICVTGLLYSVPPFKLKDRPIAGLVLNGAGALVIFGVGWFAAGGGYPGAAASALPYVCAVMGVYLLTTVQDEVGDARHGKQTFAVAYGRNATTAASLGCVITGIAAAILLQDPVVLIPSILALPLVLLAFFLADDASIDRAIKFPILLLCLAICWYWPPFFLLLAVIFYLSRYYYRHRFGLSYPSFRPVVEE